MALQCKLLNLEASSFQELTQFGFRISVSGDVNPWLGNSSESGTTRHGVKTEKFMKQSQLSFVFRDT